MTLDSRPLVRSLLEHLGAHGFTVTTVYDGETHTSTEDIEEIIDAATATDEAWLTAAATYSGAIHLFTLNLIYGNEPWELVADYSWTRGDQQLLGDLEDALDAYVQQWDGNPYPTN